MTEDNFTKPIYDPKKNQEYDIEPMTLEEEAIKNMDPLKGSLYMMEKRNPSMGAGAKTPIGNKRHVGEKVRGIGLMGVTKEVTDIYRTGTDFMTNQPKYQEKTKVLDKRLIFPKNDF